MRRIKGRRENWAAENAGCEKMRDRHVQKNARQPGEGREK